MGKPRFSDLSEEQQLEVRRQVTRELNEAAQNARDAARVLAAELGRIKSTSADTIADITDQHMKAVNEHLTRASEDLQAMIFKGEEKTRDHYARLLGETSYNGLLTFLANQVIEVLLPEINRVLGTLPGATGATRIQKRDDSGIRVIDAASYEQMVKDGTAAGLGIIIDGR